MGLVQVWLIQCQIKIDSASCIRSILPHYSRLSFFFFVHLLPISLVDKPAEELIATYIDLIILSTVFGGLAFSDPWLIVVVIFQSLTASHMLQTNPMIPTKTLAASGTHSFMKAASPVPLPSSPLHSHQYAAPGLWEVRNEADVAEHWQLRRLVLLPLRSEQCQRGEGRGRKLKPHLRRLTEVLSSQQLVLHAVSIELVCCMECPFSCFSCISDLHGNG